MIAAKAVLHSDTPEYQALVDEYEKLCEQLNDFIAHAPGKEWWGRAAWDEYNGMNDDIKRIDAIIHPREDGDDDTPATIRYNLGVIEDMESTLLPDNHTVKARGVWLMDGVRADLFYESSALAGVQHELSCAKDELRAVELERDARGNILNHAIERAECLNIKTGNGWYQAIDGMADEIIRLRIVLEASRPQRFLSEDGDA